MRDFCDTRLSVTLAYHKRYNLIKNKYNLRVKSLRFTNTL
jgi:hypothetical protein